MSKNILITSNNSLSSKFVFHTICDIAESYYKEYSNEGYIIYFLSHYSSTKRVLNLFKKENRNVFFDEIILSNDFTKDLPFTTARHWLDVYDILDISQLPKFDEIIEVGSAISQGNKLQYGVTNFNNLFMSKAQFKFISGRNLKQNILLNYKIAHEQSIKLNHFIIDPQEVNYNDFNFKNIEYERFFSYESKLFDFKKNNAFLNTYIENRVSDLDKELDFAFGYTILTQDRSNSTDMIEDIISEMRLSGLRIKIFLRDKYNGIDTFVKKDEYLENIRKSKFTLIIPSYNNKTFSAFRYIESIYSGCIPLILDSVDIEEAKQTLYIPEILIVNSENIMERIQTINNLNCETLLKEIKDKLNV